jgi:hypothetical protein
MPHLTKTRFFNWIYPLLIGMILVLGFLNNAWDQRLRGIPSVQKQGFGSQSSAGDQPVLYLAVFCADADSHYVLRSRG